MNWQPIETAPKDETRIILWREGWQEANAVGFWSESDKSWNAVGSTYFVGATHWMPLPPNPEAA